MRNETKKLRAQDNQQVETFQQNFNKYLEEQAKPLLSGMGVTNFRAFQHPEGFHYMTNDGLSYNHFTVTELDSLLKEDKKTGRLYLEGGGFSKLYHEVLTATAYVLSQESQQKVDKAMAVYSAQKAAVIKAYKDSGLPELTAATVDAALVEIYENCAKKFGGEVTKDCSIIPNSYTTLKVALQTLNNMAGDSAQIVMNQGNKSALLSNIIKNLETPNEENSGIPIDLGQGAFYAGYDGIPTSNDLVGSLGTKKNALTVTVSGEQYNEDEIRMHTDNKVSIPIPIMSLLDISVGHESTLDMDRLKTQNMQFEAQITYSGVTKIPVVPTASAINGCRGWYDETTILKEIREKTGNPDVDGYKLVDSRFDVKYLFGGDLARLETLLISKTPSVKITMRHVNMDYARSVFSMKNNLTVTLFGFITLGQHDNTYESSSVDYNEEEQSVTLSFGESDVSGTPDVKALTAFIMGGVPCYPGLY